MEIIQKSIYIRFYFKALLSTLNLYFNVFITGFVRMNGEKFEFQKFNTYIYNMHIILDIFKP